MAKSGILMFFVALIGTIIGGIIICCCGPVWAVVVGAAAGFLAGVFDKPSAAGPAAGRGAAAGGIAGVGALIGQIIASFINNAIMQQNPQMMVDTLDMLGIKGIDPSMIVTSSAPGMLGTLLGGGCWGMVELVVTAAVGALGGFLWFQLIGKNQTAVSTGVQ